MRRFLIPVTIFVLAAFVGPCLHIATRSLQFEHYPSVGITIVSLASLLWPIQPLGVMEYQYGSAITGVILITGNVLFFGLIGAAVAAAVWRTSILIIIYASVAALLCLFAYWGAGSTVHDAQMLFALAVALCFHAFLFYWPTRLVRRDH
jgi:hypothetical protein